MVPDESVPDEGKPVGRRVVLGLLGLGAAGIVGGASVSEQLGKWLGPLEYRDPTGLLAMLPIGPTFRIYSVTGSVPNRSDADYRLRVSGLVSRPATYTFADLQALPQTSFVKEFVCVTGWRVPAVHWTGVRLGELIDRAMPRASAGAVRFRSFDGTYTESLSLDDARRSDVIVALQMLGGPVSHEHGGPVRIYAASMYGYKSTKWLSEIELTEHQIAGYWEHRGYDIDGSIQD